MAHGIGSFGSPCEDNNIHRANRVKDVTAACSLHR